MGELVEISNFALLAAGGAGKSETFTALAKYEPEARLINTAALTLDGLERRIREACREAPAVYLDGLDQAAAVEPRLFLWLKDELQTPSARRVRWRLACRSASWDAAFADALRGELPGFTEWKLLPLDRSTARTAVEQAIQSPAFDGAAFLRAADEAGLGRLSACIGHLIDVARYWHEEGALPSGAVEAMTFEVGRLLQESNEWRQTRMPSDRAMRLAKRLAAFTMFAGAQALTKATTGDRATLTVGNLPSDIEPAEPGRAVDPDDYRELLDTALFDPGPTGSVVFRHQRYVEYLAAAYLADRGVHAGQVPGLLGVHDNGLLPASRVGVAAWLAALNPDLIDDLIANNALMFASAATVTELPSAKARAAVVAGLLSAAATGDARPEWSLDRAPLLHPDLGRQIADCLAAGLVSSEQLWWVARLAVAGKCHDAATELAREASNPAWYAYARRTAVEAVGVLGGEDAHRLLRALLAPAHDGHEIDLDPDNEVRAAVIDALYPSLLSTEDLTQALRPHHSLLFGGYLHTLRELPKLIPVEDLALFATWLARQTEDSTKEDQFEDLYIGVVRRAWQHSDSEAVCRALARLIVAGVHAGIWHKPHVRREGVPWKPTQTESRRALAIEIAGVRAEAWHAFLTLSLLNEDDAEWLLDTLPTVPPQTAIALVNCLPQLVRAPSARVADRILTLPSTHPAHEATAHLRETVALASEDVKTQRQFAAEDAEHQRQLANHRERVHTELFAVLGRLDAEPGSWWRIPWLLASDEFNNVTGRLTRHDLTRRPGWARLSTDQQQHVLDAGIRYLDAHDPTPADWSSESSVDLQVVLPDWEGVYLLTTLLEHDPHRLSDLPVAVWNRWAPAIVATPVFGPGEDGDLRCRLIDAAPATVRPRLIDAALNHLDNLEAGDRDLAPAPIYRHLTADLAPTIAERLITRPSQGGLARDLLDLLVRGGPHHLALDTCRRIIDRPESPLAARARSHMTELDPNGVIDSLAAAQQDPESLAEATQGLNLTRLDHDHLVTAAQLLLDSYPYSDDPPLDTGDDITPQHDARDLRSHILGELANGGYIDDLTDLRQGRRDTDQRVLARYQRIAKARQADLALAPTRPDVLMSLLRDGDARLVRDDADLQHVLLQQLDTLQRELRDTTAFREIWNGEDPQVEDDISDWIQRRFRARLDGVIIDREIQVSRPRGGGIGTRIDLTASTKTSVGDNARAIIEAKRIDNAELMTAMYEQLVTRYLVPEQRRYGIYLVYWITPDQRPASWSRATAADIGALKQKLAEQAIRARKDGIDIKPYVLDVSRPV